MISFCLIEKKNLLFDFYIFGTLIFAFYVLIGKYINYSIGSNNHTPDGINRYFQVFSEDLFNRRFPLSQTFSYYFNFFKFNNENNIIKKDIKPNNPYALIGYKIV